MDMETKIDQILKIVTNLEVRMTNLEVRITNLEVRVTKLEERVTSLERSVFLIETEQGERIKALFDAREANEDAHKRIEKAIENLKSEIQGTLFNHEKRISKLEGNLVPSF